MSRTGGARRLVARAVAVLLALVATLVSPTSAVADHTDPDVVLGNPTCSTLLEDDGVSEAKWDAVKIRNGTLTKDGFTVTFSGYDGTSFDFSAAAPPVDAVFVKGGDGGHLYSYVPRTHSDTDLTTPATANGKVPEISHVSFCFGATPKDVMATLSGRAYVDVNRSGASDDGEPGVDGVIRVFSRSGDVQGALAASVATDPVTGLWSWTTPAVPAGSSQSFFVCQVPRPQWLQTSPSSGVTLPDEGVCYAVATVGSAAESVGGNDFGAVALSHISGRSYFDDGSGLGLEGVRIEILDGATLVCLLTTAADGSWSTVGTDRLTGQPCGPLPPGTYTVRERPAVNSDVWRQTFPASPGTYTVTLTPAMPTTIAGADFGDVCFKTGPLRGRPTTFWTSSQGRTVFLARNSLNLRQLRSLDLLTTPTRPFNPTSYSEYKAWLQGARTTTRAVYKLSAEMSATWLNTRNTLNGSVITDQHTLVTWQVGSAPKQQTVRLWLRAAASYLGGGQFNNTKTARYTALFAAINASAITGTSVGTPTSCDPPLYTD